MDNRGHEDTNQTENGAIRVDRIEDLHLDRVVASQPEIGPTPPDGGYGWLIVISASVYHVTVPTILSLYALIILKAIREEDHEDGEVLKIWDVDVAMVPVIAVVIRLVLESWCRAVVKLFNMPRFMAVAGLCLTVAGVLLSSYSTDAESNDHIINVFSGICIGIGCALTGQQIEVIITHYFRNKLTIAQRVVRMAPSIGNCVMPIVVGYLSTVYSGDVVVMIYGAIIMQNCLFLATFTRPVYIEKVIRHTYNMIRDAVEDDDEVIFSNQRSNEPTNPTPAVQGPSGEQGDESTDVVVFKAKQNATEILDPEVQLRENIVNRDHRFSSNFSDMFTEAGNRFSSDFSNFSVNYEGASGYRELENIDREGQNPQPLYRGTTVDAPAGLVFPTEMSPGTARRTATLKKNFITVVSMLRDINFYLYTLLHLCTTFSLLILNLLFPVMVWEQNPSMNIWSVAALTSLAHGMALCFILMCIVLPKEFNEKTRLCAVFCTIGAMGFYGITLTTGKSFLAVWCMFASFSSAASSIIQQPLYNTLNEFDNTATMSSANTSVAIFLLAWSLIYNYEFRSCFFAASILQTATAFIFFVTSFRRRR